MYKRAVGLVEALRDRARVRVRVRVRVRARARVGVRVRVLGEQGATMVTVMRDSDSLGAEW